MAGKYGFESRHIAEMQAAELTARKDGNRYEVAPHDFVQNFCGYPSYGASHVVRTWGVQRYVPYCKAMPERFDGFVWFAR